MPRSSAPRPSAPRQISPPAGPHAFTGIRPAATAWFDALARDNTRAFFEATRDTYEAEVRGPLASLLEELAAELGGTVRMFRQHRDVRFSRDKSPYKTTTYGVIERRGTDAGLYAQLSARGLYAATGYYELARDQLARYRDAVVAPRTGTALLRIVEALDGALSVEGQGLKTVPRGYDRDHPRARLLRHTGLYAGRLLASGATLASRRALRWTAETWAEAGELVAWLDRNVGPSALTMEERFARGR